MFIIWCSDQTELRSLRNEIKTRSLPYTYRFGCLVIKQSTLPIMTYNTVTRSNGNTNVITANAILYANLVLSFGQVHSTPTYNNNTDYQGTERRSKPHCETTRNFYWRVKEFWEKFWLCLVYSWIAKKAYWWLQKEIFNKNISVWWEKLAIICQLVNGKRQLSATGMWLRLTQERGKPKLTRTAHAGSGSSAEPESFAIFFK